MDLAGSAARDESEVVFRRRRAHLERLGVIFCDMDVAHREHPDLVLPYLGTVVPPDDRRGPARHTAVGSGGSFVYVPPGVEVDMPVQAFSRIDPAGTGQFERTLIIADEGSEVHYLEGCSAPTYTSDPLRADVVEVVVKAGARVTYTAMQNWSDNVVHLVNKRARVEAEGQMVWIDGDLGSRLTLNQPAVWLVGPKASGEVFSVAFAGAGQRQVTGATVVHAAPETTSRIVSRSVSKDGGRTSQLGVVRVGADEHGCTSRVQCDALVLDERSASIIRPELEVSAGDAVVDHETSVSTVADEQLFYVMSRGLTEGQARGTIVNGFVEPVARRLPMEYAVEWSRLIELRLEGSVG